MTSTAVAISTRIELLNHLIATRGYTSYLEIGCDDDTCFNAIHCLEKTGVDPARGGTHRMTSDHFFETLSKRKRFDLVFIDGLHWCEQVDRDVDNSLRHLTRRGVIVLHDCNPPTPAHALYPRPVPWTAWNGDVWRSIVKLRRARASTLDVAVGDFDWGCGVVVRRPSTDADKRREARLSRILPPPNVEFDHRVLPYEVLAAHRRDLLRLMTPAQLLHWLDHGEARVVAPASVTTLTLKGATDNHATTTDAAASSYDATTASASS